MSGYRLAAPAGMRIARGKRIDFRFNGREYSGFEGETLASALLANGVRLVGRSFKLHRPRGIFSCGIEEPSALVDVGERARRTPNQRTTVLDLYPGLVAQSVNCWPSVGLDLGAVNNLVSSILPAGFYYKTFKWPNWHWFEPSIRRMAGLGRATLERDPDRYDEISAETDVLVIGAGLAGLSAAVAAAEAGARVMLLSSGAHLGGALDWRGDPEIDALMPKLHEHGVRVLTRTLAFGVYDHNLVCACETLAPPGAAPARGATGVLRERLWKIRARAIVSAIGAFERPIVFPDNDRPGVMLAGAAEKYARAYGVAVGKRVVIAANSDAAYGVAASLASFGIEIPAIVDLRPRAHVGAAAQAQATALMQASPQGFRMLPNSAIASVSGTRSVTGCGVVSLAEQGKGAEHVACDAILSAGGFAPAVHLHSQAGGKLRWLAQSAMFVPDGPGPGLFSVGACAGVFERNPAAMHAADVGRALATMRAAPASAARLPSRAAASRSSAVLPSSAPVPPPPVVGAGHSLEQTRVLASRKKQFIDVQNDVTAGDVALAARENYVSVEHLKRYTTMGMGTDQGKTSNINALVAMGELTGRAPDAVGTTKFRPPFAPVTLGMLVGRRAGDTYRPTKRLPAHHWHEQRGALFEYFGPWHRPAAYPRDGETLHTAAQREAAMVRRSAGIFDGSPLGKLEVFGPDAGKFLDFMYVGTLSNLATGQARYGLLLNENGVIVDDGVVARLADNRFWVNTTSAGVERTAAAFEDWLQCEFPHLQVLVTPLTSHWANVTVAGPRAWEWLTAAGFDAALAPAAMKHMTLLDSTIDGIPLRVLRASFSGELGYEINLPVNHATAMFERLWALAPRFDAGCYGIEALEIMRTEKAYIHVGSDTDGTTLPGDIGFGKAIERKASDFVGRRSLKRPAALDPERFALVGLRSVDGKSVLPPGAQIAMSVPPARTEGHVTSSFWSPALGMPVALAMLARGPQRLGERVGVHHLGTRFEAEVVKTPFFDPSGDRLHG